MTEQTRTAPALMEKAVRGDRAAAAELLPLVYEELRQLARSRLRQEAGGGQALTIQATALVHEAYVRLVGGGAGDPGWSGKGHFFGAAALAMRRLLVEHARTRHRLKRGGDRARVRLDDAAVEAPGHEQDWIGIDEALSALARHDAQLAHLVNLRFFAGLTAEQTAEAMGTSVRTVQRDWTFARAWLDRHMGGAAEERA